MEPEEGGGGVIPVATTKGRRRRVNSTKEKSDRQNRPEGVPEKQAAVRVHGWLESRTTAWGQVDKISRTNTAVVIDLIGLMSTNKKSKGFARI